MDNNHAEAVRFRGRRMVLLPDKARAPDLFHLLRTGDVTSNKLVDCHEQDPVGIKHRLVLLLSIVIQTILLFLAKPAAWIGTTIEKWINLVDDQGFAAVFFSIFLGNVVLPDPKSRSYRSIIGHADRRINFDKRITPGNEKYLPALTVMAAKLAYENPACIQNIVENHWNMELLKVFECSNDYYGHLVSTQAFMFSDKQVEPELIVVAFRGTQPFDMIQWCIDFDYSWYEHEEAGKIHEGFMRALGLQNDGEWPKEVENSSKLAYYAIKEKLSQVLRANPKARFVIAGHSLGGALAVVFPVVLMLHGENWMLDRLEGVYTYGQPRVGDVKLGEYVSRRLGSRRHFRYVYSNDVVPRLPFDDPAFQYKHFGVCYYFNSVYRGEIMIEEPNKNYFSLTDFIPKYLNAAWEIARGFLIGFVGHDYREGWVLTFLRVFGLVVPGLPAHVPQDYVNSTRLGEVLLAAHVSE